MNDPDSRDSESLPNPPPHGYRLSGPLIPARKGAPQISAIAIEQALEEMDQEELTTYLPAILAKSHHRVSDEEVLRRREELDSGEVLGLTLNEFKTACGR